MVEILVKNSLSVGGNRYDDDRPSGFARVVSENLADKQGDLIDLIDLSDAAVESLKSNDKVLQALEIYRDAHRDFLGQDFVLPQSFSEQALAIFEQRKGDVEKVIAKLEAKHAELQKYFEEKKREEKVSGLANDISAADTKGELSFLKAKLNDLRSEDLDPQEQADIARLERLIELKERGAEDEFLEAYAAFVSLIEGRGGRFPFGLEGDGFAPSFGVSQTKF